MKEIILYSSSNILREISDLCFYEMCYATSALNALFKLFSLSGQSVDIINYTGDNLVWK